MKHDTHKVNIILDDPMSRSHVSLCRRSSGKVKVSFLMLKFSKSSPAPISILVKFWTIEIISKVQSDKLTFTVTNFFDS